jgi:hypothetical protein
MITKIYSTHTERLESLNMQSNLAEKTKEKGLFGICRRPTCL